jgi:A/G-specific adenine glycosylase
MREIRIDRSRAEAFMKKLIEWYEKHGDKSLPWRSTNNPWAVLVAALLLRKTTVAQVLRMFEDFLKKYPTPRSLLSASEGEVRELIRPLGIEHQRARHLKKLAEQIEEKFGGRIPLTKEELKKLPGVGDYTASEVLLASCGKPEPLLDRNMIRVLERVFGVKSAKKRPHTDPMMWSFARTLVPEDPAEARAFNYGVLDFARKICTAGRPHCGECPIKDLCEHSRGAKSENL